MYTYIIHIYIFSIVFHAYITMDVIVCVLLDYRYITLHIVCCMFLYIHNVRNAQVAQGLLLLHSFCGEHMRAVRVHGCSLCICTESILAQIKMTGFYTIFIYKNRYTYIYINILSQLLKMVSMADELAARSSLTRC